MKLIKKDLAKIRDKILKLEEEQKKIEKIVREFISEVFKNSNYNEVVDNILIRNSVLTIKATRKIYSQEINFKKHKLIGKIPKKIKEIKIY